ncbi:MAG TPA: hypothetical protein PK252_04125 [Bacteroidales bacterium]|nr:hypothetical protein [Bacteroidales bacterium]
MKGKHNNRLISSSAELTEALKKMIESIEHLEKEGHYTKEKNKQNDK